MKAASDVDTKVEFDLIYFIIFPRYARAMPVTKEQHRYGEWMRISMAWRERNRQSNSIKLTELYACMNIEQPSPPSSLRAVHRRHTNLIPIPDNQTRATNCRIFSRNDISFEICRRNQIAIEGEMRTGSRGRDLMQYADAIRSYCRGSINNR